MHFNKNSITFFSIILSLIFIANPIISQESEKSKLEVICPKNIEVFSTLINLTSYWKKRHTPFPFATEARERFLPFKDHQAVKMTQKFLKKHWQSFFFGLALYHTELPEAKPVNISLLESSGYFSQGETEEIKDYISEVRDFYQKSDYEKFWQEKKDFYEELKESILEKIKDIDIPKIMEDFYGMKKDKYFIVPAPQILDMAVNIELVSEGKLFSYDIQGPLEIKEGKDYFINVGDLVSTAFHEFGHTFLESAVDKHDEFLNKYDYIYKEAKKGMRQKGYRSWHQVFMENLLGAVQAHLGGKALGEKFSRIVLDVKSRKGFQLTPYLYEIIKDYEQNRDKYKNFESFIPNLFAELDERMKKE